MSERGETLTDSMLAALRSHLRPIQQGKYLRAGCPFHGSEHQRSLSINNNTETGRFQCFSCSAWGYTEHARENWKADNAHRPQAQPWLRSSGTDRLRCDGDEPEPLPDDWLQQLEEWQARLPAAAEYLAQRRISLELVQRLGAGVGKFGNALRLILPHTDPQGRIVSLYGRRIDGGAAHKHYHIGGRPKGLACQKIRFLRGPPLDREPDQLLQEVAGFELGAQAFGAAQCTHVSRLPSAFPNEHVASKLSFACVWRRLNWCAHECVAPVLAAVRHRPTSHRDRLFASPRNHPCEWPASVHPVGRRRRIRFQGRPESFSCLDQARLYVGSAQCNQVAGGAA